MTRKWTAGALTTLLCLIGLTAPVAAASGSGKGRVDPTSIVTGLDAPKYGGRKSGDDPKLDQKLNERATFGGVNTSRVIIMLKPGCSVDADLAKLGGKKYRDFSVISGQVAEVPNFVLRKLTKNPCVTAIHSDRGTSGEMNYAATVEGARAVQAAYGYDGAGVGVAIIDSGITSWHDDLTYRGNSWKVQVVNNQRVVKFVDFVNGMTAAYDDNGHGSHVAGIIAGNGYDSNGARAGMAPAADIVSLKVLDQNGNGHISDVIAALDWVVANRTLYNIRVVNLSIGAPVTESYYTDPLTLAAKRVVDTGVVVVTAAGNLGKNKTTGQIQYGAITAPGNAPWVLTVGAYNHEGTLSRADDQIAPFSSRGPTAVDFKAKPDVVATGVGIASLSVPGSTLFNLNPQYLLGGTLAGLLGSKPYLSLSGTSMASPVVAGTVALMLQANPKLTPNLVKAIIEYTSQDYGYDTLTQGAGFLNAKGAVDVARFLNHPSVGQKYPSNLAWSKTILWGNRKVTNGVIKPTGTAWAVTTVWGSISDVAGNNIVWGTRCASQACDNLVWGASDMDADNIVWGTSTGDGDGDNIVWGTQAAAVADNIVWGSASLDGDADNIVWGTQCGDADCDNIVWGSNVAAGGLTNIVWGTANMQASNIVWGSSVDGDIDNIVWGSSTDGDGDNIVWGSSASEEGAVFADPLTTDPSAAFELDADYVVPPSGSSSTDPTAPTPVATNYVAPPAIDPTASPSGGDTAHVTANLVTTVASAVIAAGGTC
jgi:serine protease AprX